MRPLIVVLLALGLTLPALARPKPDSLTSALDAVLADPTLGSASLGVEVRRLPQGSVVYSRNAEKSLRPASILKLVTTATALDLLGPDRRFATTVETTAVRRPIGSSPRRPPARRSG